jgi:phosphohistidine phosphatase
MELYFLRHGIAVDRDNPKYNDDSIRPLTTPGVQKMRTCARGMQTLDLSFDTILCSPYIRAKQTALIVAETFKLKESKINFTGNLIPEAPVEKLPQEIRTDYAGSKSILFVGHEPHLTGCISFLLNQAGLIPINLKKGGLCHLTLPNPEATTAVLNWLLTPSQLCLMAREAT